MSNEEKVVQVRFWKNGDILLYDVYECKACYPSVGYSDGVTKANLPVFLRGAFATNRECSVLVAPGPNDSMFNVMVYASRPKRGTNRGYRGRLSTIDAAGHVAQAALWQDWVERIYMENVDE